MWSDSVKPRESIIAGRAATVETKDVPNEVEEFYALNISSGHISPHCVVLVRKVKYISPCNTT